MNGNNISDVLGGTVVLVNGQLAEERKFIIYGEGTWFNFRGDDIIVNIESV